MVPPDPFQVAMCLSAGTESLFGSAARGNGDTRSDLDLLVIGPDEADEEWEAHLFETGERILAATGNPAGDDHQRGAPALSVDKGPV